MNVYMEEVIMPSLRGTQHNKVFSIWGDDFSFSTSEYSYNYIQKLFTMFQDKAQEVWGRKMTFKFASV